MKKKFILSLVMLTACVFCDTPKSQQEKVALDLENIVLKAELHWPGDYRMQQHEIKQQSEAYFEIFKAKEALKNQVPQKKGDYYDSCSKNI